MLHLERYVEFSRCFNHDPTNPAHIAALYLLASDFTLAYHVQRYTDKSDIPFLLMKRSFSQYYPEEAILLNVVHNLYAGTAKCAVTPHDIASLDKYRMEDVLAAIRIAGGQARIVVKEYSTFRCANVVDVDSKEMELELD